MSRHVVLCADAREVDWRALPTADLVFTDPPWKFDQANGKPPPYPGLPVPEIVDVLFACGGFEDHVGLAVWVTAAHFHELIAELVRRRLPLPITLGAWDKGADAYGQGAWWASRMEFLFRWNGGHAVRERSASNGVRANRTDHSEKPEAWQAQLVARWCPPDGVVLDPFMGLGSVQRAARREGRSFVGVELDVKRFTTACTRALDEGLGPLEVVRG